MTQGQRLYSQFWNAALLILRFLSQILLPWYWRRMVRTTLPLWVTVPSCTVKSSPRPQQIFDGKPPRAEVFTWNKCIQAPQMLKNVLVIIFMVLKLENPNKTVNNGSILCLNALSKMRKNWSIKKVNESPQHLREARAGILHIPSHAAYSQILLQLHQP